MGSDAAVGGVVVDVVALGGVVAQVVEFPAGSGDFGLRI